MWRLIPLMTEWTYRLLGSSPVVNNICFHSVWLWSAARSTGWRGRVKFNPPPHTRPWGEWRTQGPCSWFQGDLAGCDLFFQFSRVFVTQFCDMSVISCSVGKQRGESRLDLIGLVLGTEISVYVQEIFPHQRRSACIKTVKNLVRCLCRTCCKSTHNPNVFHPIRGQHWG